MATTNFNRLVDEQLTWWKKETWKQARDMMFTNRFLGTGPNSMIQRITELTKSEKGARAVITLVADLEGDGKAGDRQLEGNEEEIKAYDQVIRIDQLRHANIHEGRMTDQKSVVRFRENSRDVLAHWLADRYDQQAFLALSGVSFEFKTNGALRTGSELPLLEYAADVTAPSPNRHIRWDGTNKQLEAGDTSAVAPGDLPSWAMLVEAKAHAKDNFIQPISGEDGTELYHVFMTPTGFAKLKQDDDFIRAWRHAMPRSTSNPIFKGLTSGIMVDGFMLWEYRHVYNTKGAASPNKWGAAGDVDGQRILICGRQALGMADIGDPYWVEKGFDYENRQGVSVGKMAGMLKPKFKGKVQGGDQSPTEEDFGVLVLDTALVAA